MSISTLTAPKSHRFADLVATVADVVVERVRREWYYRITVAELRRLSDRILADLGTTRDGIPAFARRTISY